MMAASCWRPFVIFSNGWKTKPNFSKKIIIIQAPFPHNTQAESALPPKPPAERAPWPLATA